MTISDILQNAKYQLNTAGITTAHLDSELLLAHTLDKNRAWLIAHSDEELTETQRVNFELLIKRRLDREPVAYITSKKEFYSREFIVTPDTLIPRPDTEDLVDLALSLLRVSDKQVSRGGDESRHKASGLLDVGTGSGCIGITLKLEQPEWEVFLCDISPGALKIARHNALILGAHVTTFQSDLLSHWLSHGKPKLFDMIVANLPYVDESWDTSPELKHEPSLALYADDNGLALIKKLIEQSVYMLPSQGYLLLEADPEQHSALIRHARTYGLHHEATNGYALALRLTTADR